jgi:hypothetical protein
MWWLRIRAPTEPEREQMAQSLRNLLILDNISSGAPGRFGEITQTWPNFVKGMSIALSSGEEIR